MLNDTYSEYIPKQCVNKDRNAFWDVDGLSKMVAVALKECIMIECLECGHTFYIYLDENGKPIKKNK